MIGQNNLQSRIEHLINTDGLPRFSIFVGPKGSGKKTFVRELINSVTDGLYEECGIKVDDIRNLIVDAYKIHSTAVYFIPDADKLEGDYFDLTKLNNNMYEIALHKYYDLEYNGKTISTDNTEIQELRIVKPTPVNNAHFIYFSVRVQL